MKINQLFAPKKMRSVVTIKICAILMLDRDVKDHVKTFFGDDEHSEIDQCRQINELWLIQNSTGITNP